MFMYVGVTGLDKYNMPLTQCILHVYVCILLNINIGQYVVVADRNKHYSYYFSTTFIEFILY